MAVMGTKGGMFWSFSAGVKNNTKGLGINISSDVAGLASIMDELPLGDSQNIDN